MNQKITELCEIGVRKIGRLGRGSVGSGHTESIGMCGLVRACVISVLRERARGWVGGAGVCSVDLLVHWSQ
jgi:hypothetical protein